jgi:hypothetical protein
MTHAVNLIHKTWDSNFFNRDIYELSGYIQSDPSALNQLGKMLDTVLIDKNALVQVKVESDSFQDIPVLEGEGFRFVDSRLEFLTTEERLGNQVLAPAGVFREFSNSDWDQVGELTFQSFAGNSRFMSRYNNRQYFSVDDSHRYYMQWHKLVLENQHPMFCIWDVGGEICGFYTIDRKLNDETGVPFYKVGLGAVKEGHRSFGAQNLMQQWLFSQAVDPKWVTVNSPALTNKAGIKNNIRAQKNFDRAEVFMFANRDSRSL